VGFCYGANSYKIYPLKWAYNEFFEGKKAVFSRSRRQQQSDIIDGFEGYQLREGVAHSQAFFEAENEDIGPENTYLWDNKGA
jgi:hypothetical protein